MKKLKARLLIELENIAWFFVTVIAILSILTLKKK
jgi:hypothetical protein